MLTDGGPMITARLTDGPMSGTTTKVAAVEGRPPPKTIDVDGPATREAATASQIGSNAGMPPSTAFSTRSD